MKSHTRIAAAGNTLPAALATLTFLGYVVTLVGNTMQAERRDCILLADDPLALLGLAALYEHRGDDWGANDDEVATFLALDLQSADPKSCEGL